MNTALKPRRIDGIRAFYPRAEIAYTSVYDGMQKPRALATGMQKLMQKFKARMSDERKTGDGDTPDTGIAVKVRPKTKKPAMYKVLMLNDDYTPMEFVVHVLEQFFGMGHESAMRIMLHVHQKGVGICGVFTYEIAETKVNQVTDLARQHQHPLQCTIEKDE